MLAYVFWHIPRAGTEAAAYEDRVIGFHEMLQSEPPAGFRESAVLRHYALPWAPSSMFVYEDWYLVDGFEALGTLNEAAVSSPRKESHDAAAASAAWGAGGVYAPHSAAELAGGFSYWFDKTVGLGYEDFYEEVGVSKEPRLWRRQLVLGPAPEFCVLSSTRIDFPTLDVFESSARTVFPGAH